MKTYESFMTEAKRAKRQPYDFSDDRETKLGTLDWLVAGAQKQRLAALKQKQLDGPSDPRAREFEKQDKSGWWER